MTDIVGPANAPNAVTARPADTRSFGALDSWFKDCTSALSNDGPPNRRTLLGDTQAREMAIAGRVQSPQRGAIPNSTQGARFPGCVPEWVRPVAKSIYPFDDKLLPRSTQLAHRLQSVDACPSGACHGSQVHKQSAPR